MSRLNGTHERPDSEAINSNNYSFKTVEKVFSAFPQKKPKMSKKEAEELKAKQAEEEAIRKAMPRNETNDFTLKNAISWQNSVSISKKFAAGTVTTKKWEEKTEKFSAINDSIADKSNIYPLSNYFGKPPNEVDPYDRRNAKKLEDIDFSEDEENDFEDVRNIKRQPRSVLTEENLREYLGPHTLRLNLEHHYWLKDSFLGKIGRMSTNIQVLSLRRLQISNKMFTELWGINDPVEIWDWSLIPEYNEERIEAEFADNKHYL